MQLFACFERRVRDAVDTHEFRGNALAHFGIVMRGTQDGEPGMRMQIDEARANHMVGSINHTSCLQGRGITSVNRHALVFDEHCGIKAGTPTPVNDQTMLNE
jgi:hypothetical protein